MLLVLVCTKCLKMINGDMNKWRKAIENMGNVRKC